MTSIKYIIRPLLILLLAVANNSYAQLTCGFDSELKKSIENDASVKVAHDKFQSQIQNYHGGNQTLGGAINFIIPVVVHIIHDNGVSNISDAQVKDAIRILNEDFQKNSADTSLVDPAFKSIIGDIGVEFRLANIDPSGNCTNGITRTFSYLTNAGSGSDAKSLISWDTKKYYNIWVVNYLESNGTAVGGYSFLPGTAPASEKEGSIMLNKQFGSIGTSSNSPLPKSTLTHETGHFLGLYHTWGVSSAAGSSAACGDDDQVSDTPNTSGTVNSCNTSQVTCGTLDNIQNYMDYSNCPYMFTEGQKTRMSAALNSGAGYRSSLWTTNNLIATGVNDGYLVQECAPIADFYSSRKAFCIGDTVAFYDISYNDSLSSNRSWEWTFEGGNPAASTLQNPVITYNQRGKYKVKLKTYNAKGENTIEKSNYVEVFTDDIKTYLYYTEGFEEANFPIYQDSSKSWVISSPGNIAFARTTAAKTSGDASISVDLHTESGCTHSLISPNFDLSTVTAPINYSFDYAYAQRNSNNKDVLKVYISYDCGNSWKLKSTVTTTNLKTKEPTSGNFIPSSSEWLNLVVNLNGYAGKPNFRIKTDVIADGGNKLYIDNVLFYHGNVSVANLTNKSFSASVFPNPINENSVLSIETHEIETFHIEIYDVVGRKVCGINNLQSNTIPIKDLYPLKEKGIYFIKIFNNVEIKTISILF